MLLNSVLTTEQKDYSGKTFADSKFIKAIGIEKKVKVPITQKNFLA